MALPNGDPKRRDETVSTSASICVNRRFHLFLAESFRLRTSEFNTKVAKDAKIPFPQFAFLPALRSVATMKRRKPSVLFVCTGNAGRSQMAQALFRRLMGDAVRVESAGVEPWPRQPGSPPKTVSPTRAMAPPGEYRSL